MKIPEARQAYSAQAGALWNRRQALSKLLKEQPEDGGTLSAFDRVEIGRALEETDKEYERTQGILESLTARENMIRDTESARQQSEAIAKAADEMLKMMEVFRRIASGAKVPSEDERKLMEYDAKLYMAAKAAAMLAQEKDKEYDSLWKEDEESGGEEKSADEIVAETEAGVARPVAPAPVEAAAAE